MVKVKLIGGTCKLLRMYNTPDDSDNILEIPFITGGVKVFIGDTDIAKDKGKYVKTKTYIKHLFSNVLHCDSDNRYVESPIEVFPEGAEFEFDIDGVDEDDFNLELLQLEKSDYELDELPYGINSI